MRRERRGALVEQHGRGHRRPRGHERRIGDDDGRDRGDGWLREQRRRRSNVGRATSGGGAESTGGASSGGTTSGGTTSGSSGSGGGTPPSKACQSCAQNAVDSQCASAHTQCTGDFACNQLLECHGDCDWTTQCNQMCDAIIPSGVPLFEALITCIACDVCGAPCAGSTVAAYGGP